MVGRSLALMGNGLTTGAGQTQKGVSGSAQLRSDAAGTARADSEYRYSDLSGRAALRASGPVAGCSLVLAEARRQAIHQDDRD